MATSKELHPVFGGWAKWIDVLYLWSEGAPGGCRPGVAGVGALGHDRGCVECEGPGAGGGSGCETGNPPQVELPFMIPIAQ